MTREEAKTIILKHPFVFASMPDDVIEAINYLVLEQEPVLDKVRAEIINLSDGVIPEIIWNVDVLKIIDKYKSEAESEVEDGEVNN